MQEQKKETTLPDMITFKGKLTCSPNTLNNQFHTYCFAYRWQQQNKKEIFQRLRMSQNHQARQNTINSMEWRRSTQDLRYSQKKWMELINSVANFNRAYVECFNKIFPQKPKLNFMDFKAFRLFHDWDVWGDSTSFPELKATSVINCQNLQIQNLKDKRKDVYLSSKMGGNKCIIANQDTDSQGKSKLFSFTLNMNEQLKLNTSPSVCREIHFRTVDTLLAILIERLIKQIHYFYSSLYRKQHTNEQTMAFCKQIWLNHLIGGVGILPWTSSMGVDWFSSGRVSLLHTGIKKQNIKYPFNTIYKTSPNTHCLFRMMQYRYNHPTKVSNVVGYIMNTDSNNPCPNKYWRIIQASGEYKNPNPAKLYNTGLNSGTAIEVYIQNIYKEQGKNGVLIDLSGAILDGNDKNNFPNYPESFKVTITQEIQNQIVTQIQIFFQTKSEVQNFFHYQSAIHIVPNRRIVDGVQIKIEINQNVRSQLIQQPINIKLSGEENEYQVELKDRFVKTKIHDDHRNIHNNYIEQTLLITRYGQLYTGSLKISLKSQFNVDSSGLTQYTKNKDYLNFINAAIQKKVHKMDPNANFDDYKVIPPEDRLNLILHSTSPHAINFKDKFGHTLQNIDNNVFQGKLKQIFQMTDEIVAKLFHQNVGLSYYFLQGDQKIPFQLCFRNGEQNSYQDTIQFINGQATIKIYLNEDLTKQNNPRSPSMQSLCILGNFIIEIPGKKTFQSPDFTGIFYENSFVFDKQNNGHGFVDPYEKIDWLNVVGPKLRVMGLMYPSMQKIVDLYNYDGLSMDAMKRAFEIQDENHSRYMPATRQMSPITHRQIRRWLYNPIYDAKVKIKPIPIRNNFLSFLFHSHKDVKNVNNTNDHKDKIQSGDFPKKIQNLKEEFENKKDQLIQLVKAAFKLQLTTIPIYLSALYSLQKEGQTSKLIRTIAKDEMRHLFIVSNLMNALYIAERPTPPPYPVPKQQTPKDIPSFPIDINDLMVFHFQHENNLYWRQLMSQISIQPCNQRQLLKFIVIEVPSEIYDVKYQYDHDEDTKKQKGKPPKYSVESLIKEIDKNIQFLLGKIAPDTAKKIQRLTKLKQRIENLDRLITAVGVQLTKNQRQVEDQNKFLTIGMAYQKIMKLLWQLDDLQKLCDKSGVQVKLFSGDIRKQYTYIYLKNMTKIFDLRTALEQIRLITEQGEGSNLFNLTGQLNQTSHFIKFLEIYTGCDISIHSEYTKNTQNNVEHFERTAIFNLKPNEERFPYFGRETQLEWTQDTSKEVWETVNKEIREERFSDNLQKTTFPNVYAPISFLNAYEKILEQLGFIFTSDPQVFIQNNRGANRKTEDILLEYDAARMKAMENAIAKMRQMTMHASHIVRPNDTYNTGAGNYQTTAPKYNLGESHYIERPRE